MAPQKRSLINLCVDRLVGWWCGLPRESCSYTVESLHIPVADQINLAANLYQPTIPKPYGTIIVRTFYGIGPLMALGHARMFASRGYQVLLAAYRGTDASDGHEPTLGFYKASDGLATVAWMREQPW
jgi:predicted acyl esterase